MYLSGHGLCLQGCGLFMAFDGHGLGWPGVDLHWSWLILDMGWAWWQGAVLALVCAEHGLRWPWEVMAMCWGGHRLDMALSGHGLGWCCLVIVWDGLGLGWTDHGLVWLLAGPGIGYSWAGLAAR
jgi:hypothetical protein